MIETTTQFDGSQVVEQFTAEGEPVVEQQAVGGDAGGSDAVDEGTEGHEPTADGEKKKPGGFQRRISALTAEKETLRAEIEALRNPKADPPPFVEKPVLANFESYEAYSEALVDWKVEQRDVKRAEDAKHATVEAEAREMHSTFLERQMSAMEKYPDYKEVTGQDIAITPAMQQFLLESEAGPDLAYALGKDPAEAKRIAGLRPVAQFRELSKLENTLGAKAATATPPKQQPRASNAPEPITPLNARSAPVAVEPESMSFKEFDAWREKRAG